MLPANEEGFMRHVDVSAHFEGRRVVEVLHRLDLTLLAPTIQEQILFTEVVAGQPSCDDA
jgi:hypothetical protein